MPNRLSELLGAPLPPGVAALPRPVLDKLAELVETARTQQARDLDLAFDALVQNVPFPVRGVARRVLRG